MKNLKLKLITAMVLFISVIIIAQISVYATNESVEIVKKSETEYLIYVKDNLNTNFSFAFSNDQNVNPDALTYVEAAQDAANEQAKKIAFVNSTSIGMFDNDTYMWVKSSDKYILKGIKIDLSNSITDSELKMANDLTKTIKVDLTQVDQTKETINGVETTKIVGKIVLVENGNYTYRLVKASMSEDYTNFTKLAEKISKLTDEASFYTKLETYVDFYNMYNRLKNSLSSENWLKVENNVILQPEDAIDGEEYVLWIKDIKNNEISLTDVQFLSCKKEMSQEKIV